MKRECSTCVYIDRDYYLNMKEISYCKYRKQVTRDDTWCVDFKLKEQNDK